MKILVLEDDDAHAELIGAALTSAGHQVEIVNNGRLAVRRLESATADLLVLDWSVPDLSGLDVLVWARSRIGADIPILMLTSRGREDDVAKALEAGADDYMVKPVRSRELAARVGALLRRTYSNVRRDAIRIEFGDYVIDIRDRTVTVSGQLQTLTPREFDLASLLFRHPGRIFPRDELCKAVWGKDVRSDSRTLDTHIYRLRQKLDLSPRHGVRLRSVYQHGYCLEEAIADEAREAVPEAEHPDIFP
ncbi:response regulator transcription factor [Paraburkholderia kururiensis]|uniref:Response regulator transcription factor n=1 Tax=Paraburkholderia kururiensis TaxID=984307 RepID=A0ABZ0WLA9_9BURK|nr:response regulator transcription factor [Paraburkholderia kururiensis]WQD78157.1 response regulator transcription factor [Paraburkholderia kururiensis]